MLFQGNLEEKLESIQEYWSPKIIGELNGQYVKLAKLKGEFVWHAHEEEDELFFVIKGNLEIHFRDEVKKLSQGDFIIVPKGVEHKPIANEEVHIMLFEPKSTINTGEAESELKKENLDWI
ncbi:MAG: cupin domain-containing protein [Bacteroidia bacterium]